MKEEIIEERFWISNKDCKNGIGVKINSIQSKRASGGGIEKERAIKQLEKMEAENDVKIEKLEIKLHNLKCEQDQIIETIKKLKWQKGATIL